MDPSAQPPFDHAPKQDGISQDQQVARSAWPRAKFLRYIATCLLLVAVFAGFLLVTLKIAAPKQVSESNSPTRSSGGGESLKAGSVDTLSGTVTVERNLKGLTLRINQIDTCDQDSISTYIAVTSDAGVVNKNFKKSDISVYLDGSRVSSFDFSSVGLSQPSNIALAIDGSGSMRGAALDNAKAAATAFIGGLASEDQSSVLSFSSKSNVLSAMGKSKSSAISAIATIKASGDTALYDASLDAIAQTPQCGRRAVILLSDGDDTASRANKQSVITTANTRNVPIFSIGLASSGFDPDTLTSIANSTGGQFLSANSPAEINGLYQSINSQLQGQFKINLTLPVQKSGSRHTLKVVSNVEGSPTSSSREFVF